MPFGGQIPPVNSSPGILDRLAGKEACIEERPEPGDEKHHLRGDEQNHAVAVADLHDAGVEAAVLRFLDDIAPPGEHDVEDAEEAGSEDIGCRV